MENALRQTRLPLDGVRILDLSLAWAGPMAGRMLGEMGAEIIKIEGASKMDRWRGGTSPQRGKERYADGVPGEHPWNRNAFYNTQNVNKRSLSLNLKSARGIEIFKQLVAVSDMVLENFSAAAMSRLGLEYDDLRAIKQDIVMISMPGFGKTGPERDYVAHGPTIEAFAGNLALQGYAGSPPMPSGLLAWGDPVAGISGGFAALVAWSYHELTGKGTRVDLSHVESAIPFNFEAFLDSSIAGIERVPMGNADPRMQFQDAFPSPGTDRWMVLSCPDIHAVEALADLVGSPTARGSDLHGAVTAWSAQTAREDALARLHERGIPAGPVQDAHELNEDPQLAARGFFRRITHPEAGTHQYPGLPWNMRERPWRSPRPAPRFGEHTDEILESMGILSEERELLYADGVIARDPAPQAD